jgi:tetratricopeptide (TPR) repeat protein
MLNLPKDQQTSIENSDLNALHKEVIETRNLAIKTDNLVKTLSAEIKNIGKWQVTNQQKHLFNSAAAYILFVIIIFSATYLLFKAQTSNYERSLLHNDETISTMNNELSEMRQILTEEEEANSYALQLFELIQNGRREETVDLFPRVQSQLTNQVIIDLLRERVEGFRFSLAHESFREGMMQFQAEEWAIARDRYLESLHHLSLTPWTPELNYHLGRSLYLLEDYEGSLQYFESALSTEDLDASQMALSHYYKALALEETGRLSEALEAFRLYRREFSTHTYTARALRHSQDILRQIERSTNSQ